MLIITVVFYNVLGQSINKVTNLITRKLMEIDECILAYVWTDYPSIPIPPLIPEALILKSFL